MELRSLALEALQIKCAQSKSNAVRAINDNTPVNPHVTLYPTHIPGRPAHPILISPHDVKFRSVHSPEGKICLLHAIAHIEFNAINLALDIAWRYTNMPEQFYQDWLQVAKEEVYHFNLIRQYLQDLGSDYGKLPAHNGLWEMAEKTNDNLLARLAMVPRTLESRGLDVSPDIRDKFIQVKDQRAADINNIILRDEIGHVLIGNKWFKYQCQQENIADSLQYYDHLFDAYGVNRPKAPFNYPDRAKGGFEPHEIEWLRGLE